MIDQSKDRRSRRDPAIANLLPNDSAAATFAAFDAERLRTFEQRLVSAHVSWSDLRQSVFEQGLLDEFEELESEASSVALEALLGRVEAARRAAITGNVETPSIEAQPGQPVRARLLVHRFATSLGTGEAEVAARGFFDSWDRPPLSLWLEALTRPLARNQDGYELSVLVYVPGECVEAASEGRRACSSGALSFLDEFDGELSQQLMSRLSLLPGQTAR